MADGTGSPVDFIANLPAGNKDKNPSLPPASAPNPSPMGTTSTPVSTPAAASGPVAFSPGYKDKLNADIQDATARAQNANTVLDKFITAADQVQAQRVGDITKVVAAKQAINNQEATETQALMDRATPLFQRRVAIAQRMQDLANMNPLKRMFVSAFSLGHNPEWLGQQDKAAQDLLSVYGQQYSTMMGLHDKVLAGIAASYENADAVRAQTLEGMHEDVKFAAERAQGAQQVITTEVQGLQGETELLRAQTAERNDLLGSLLHPQINQLLAKANANGGQTVLNGVTLRSGELKDRQMQLQEQELQIAQRGVALAAGRIDLANAAEARAYAHMGTDQIKGILASGKMPDGSPANMELATRAFAASQARDEAVAKNAEAGSAIPAYQSLLMSTAGATDMARQRAFDLMGGHSQELDSQTALYIAKVKSLDAAIQAAGAQGGQGAKNQAIIDAMGQVQELQKGLLTARHAAAVKWGGGDKDLTDLAESYMSGEPLNSQTAASAYVKMARGGIPAGSRLSGTALETLKVVKGIVDKYDASQGGLMTGPQPMGIRSGKVIDPALLKQVTSAINAQYTHSTNESVLDAAPTIASKIIGPDGQPHPFSRVNAQDFAAARKSGDEQGMQTIATKMGITKQQAEQLFQEGPNGAMWKQYQAKHQDQSYGAAAKALLAAQTQITLNALDHSSSAKPDFKPSAAFADLLKNGEFQQRAMGLVDAQSQTSAGDYMSHSIAGNNWANQFYSYANTVAGQQYAQRQAEIMQAVNTSSKLRNLNPVDSATIAMHSIDSLSEGDAKKLLGAVLATVKHQTGQSGSPVQGTALDTRLAEDNNSRMSDAIDDVIKNQRFQDPALEKIRATAARDWAKRRVQVEAGIKGLLAAGRDQ